MHGSRLSAVERRCEHNFDPINWELYHGSCHCKHILQFTFGYKQLLQQRRSTFLWTTVEFFCERFGGELSAKQLDSVLSFPQILTLYAQRPIVEKHARYALYHPFAEAVSSMICDLPYKIVNAITFNLPLYFMTNLRREPEAFFVFLLFSFVSTLTMSMIYRTIGAASRTLAQALVPAAIILLALIIYAGFILPVGDMGPWFRWINYLNPIAYAFESLMLNEFAGQSYPCSTFVPQGPDYLDIRGRNRVCSAVGATAGSNVVLGEAYLRDSFGFSQSHLWR